MSCSMRGFLCTRHHDDPVTIKAVELSIIDKAWESGWVKPVIAENKTGKKVAIVGSGPAGLAAAQQLCRAGHDVTVYERDDRMGGLLRYGIPEYKMEKNRLDRRLDQMKMEGVQFIPNSHIGINTSVESLREEYNAMLLTGGACEPRDLPVPGRDLNGIHFAMEYLIMQNKRCEGDVVADDDFISARNKHVVIIGGGDTGADCLGTANRQGARSVHQLEILPRPPDKRSPDNPWPLWPQIYRVSSAHEEGVERVYSVSTRRFLDDGNGHIKALELVKIKMKNEQGQFSFEEIPGSEFNLMCELALLAMGFIGPEKPGMLERLGVKLTDRDNVARDRNWMTNIPGVFTAGDMQRGQSLIVWAMAEGRSAARGVDAYLMGSSDLPAPL